MSLGRILVAGATGGIGRAVAATLLRQGSQVLLHGRDPARLQALEEEAHHWGQAAAIAADLTQAEAVAQLHAQVARQPRLDAMVWCAGSFARSEDPAVLAQQLAANLLAPYALIRALLPLLIEAHGQVVLLNSTQGLQVTAAGNTQFAATMHAMRAVADGLRQEVNEHGVRVVSVFLGSTASARQARIHAMEGRAYRPEKLIQPDDVAEAVLGLLRLPRTVEATQITLRPMQKP